MLGEAMREEIPEGVKKTEIRARMQAKRAAARDICLIWSRLPTNAAPLEPVLSAEDREARLEAALDTEEMRAWLISRGWTPPEAKP